MKIFLYCSTLTGFTSSIPMRGLVLETIKLRPDDTFILYFNSNDQYIPYMKKFFDELNKFKNIQLLFANYSKKLSNLKALLGISNYLNIKVKADLYISPGTVDFFGKTNLPLINILADLSTLRCPQYSSVPWHGPLIFRRLLWLAVQYASKIICISKFTEKDLHSMYPETLHKTFVIYNGIEPEWFDSYYDKIDIDGYTNYEYGYWIWYGYISKRKNILNLLKAYQWAQESEYNARLPRLILIGSVAPNQKVILNYISSKLSESVMLLPHMELYKLKYLVRFSRGLVFPSFYEGFGLPIIEAFSQGVPVLHSNISSMPEISGGLGIECNPYDIESIKNGLLTLERIRYENGAIERKNWAKNFTYRRAAENFSKIIEEVFWKKNDKI